jgi:iron-sulfur cluster insertion protein
MSHVTVTENAAKRILTLIAKRNKPGLMLRIIVLGGGCSGFQYKIELDDQLNEDDKIFDQNNIKLVVDETSLGLLEGMTLDYVEELIGASFQIKNPNATASCGCGNSFAI